MHPSAEVKYHHFNRRWRWWWWWWSDAPTFSIRAVAVLNSAAAICKTLRAPNCSFKFLAEPASEPASESFPHCSSSFANGLTCIFLLLLYWFFPFVSRLPYTKLYITVCLFYACIAGISPSVGLLCIYFYDLINSAPHVMKLATLWHLRLFLQSRQCTH